VAFQCIKERVIERRILFLKSLFVQFIKQRIYFRIQGIYIQLQWKICNKLIVLRGGKTNTSLNRIVVDSILLGVSEVELNTCVASI